ncbi:MAG: hypothetical protein K6B43_10010 [Treponema sp.]|nr:hypothetical protein [Treponema sp.]
MGDIDDFLQAQIDSVIFAANDNSNTKFSAELGFVENWLAQNARKNGLDIFGFRHTIDNYFVKHAFNGHGNANQEAKRGQIAISESDIRNISVIFKNQIFLFMVQKIKSRMT